MKEKKYLSLSAEISENEEFSFDDSLIPVDIKVMHDGLNLNDSTFYEEAIENAKESLKNKPILGYVKQGEGEDTSDFAGHEVELIFGDDGVKYNYLERPLGVVPEANSYSIMEEDGKKFVHCRGYLWREYLNGSFEILQKNPKKSVSMEIAVDDFEFNEDETINITKYRYLGITILGDDVAPAMTGSEMNVIGKFSMTDNSDLYQKIEELNQKIDEHLAISNETNTGLEGGDKVKKEDNKVEDFLEEDIEIEDDGDVSVQEATDAVVKAEGSKLEEDINDARNLVNALEETEEKETLIERLDAIVVEDTEEVEEEVEEADEDYELKYSDLLVEFNELTEKFNALNTLANELKEFKAIKDAEELEAKELEIREEKVSYINENYPTLKDDVKEMFIGKVDEYEDVEDIDADICVYIVKNKISFSKAKKEVSNVKVDVVEDNKNRVMSPYGALFSKSVK